MPYLLAFGPAHRLNRKQNSQVGQLTHLGATIEKALGVVQTQHTSITLHAGNFGVSDSDDQIMVEVDLGPRSYQILIVSQRLTDVAKAISDWFRNRPEWNHAPGTTLVVTDTNVAATHAMAVGESLEAAGWRVERLEIQPGEASKSPAMVSTVYDRLVDIKADRNTPVVAVGGGVVGDLAGFAAATYARGLPFIQVPTTLLAHVDSSVGGKVGVNHPRAKNLIGAFYQPLGVFIDTNTLGTLPERDFRSGLAEVIKYGVILDGDFFDFLEKNVEGLQQRTSDIMRLTIAKCCRLKADVVEQDEQERTGLRAVLNYGHTFAHAFEALCGYGTLLHGEAVAIGMVYASQLAQRRGLIDRAVTQRQISLFEAVGLPTSLPESTGLTVDGILEVMKLDKKTVGGQLRFVLPTKLGHVELFDDVPDDDVRAILSL